MRFLALRVRRVLVPAIPLLLLTLGTVAAAAHKPIACPAPRWTANLVARYGFASYGRPHGRRA